MPQYHLNSWRKSTLFQKPSVQIPKAFYQHGIVEKAKMISTQLPPTKIALRLGLGFGLGLILGLLGGGQYHLDANFSKLSKLH